MRTRTIAYGTLGRERATGKLVNIDAQIWCWIEEKGLWVRVTRPVPAEDIAAPSKGVAPFLREARAAAKNGVALPVVRGGDFVTIGSVRVADGELADSIDAEFGGVTWHAFQKTWLLAKAANGQLVACWQMPKGNHLLEVFVLEIDADPWMSDGHFAIRVRPDVAEREREKMLATARKVDLTKLVAQMEAARAGQVVGYVRGTGDRARIGPVMVPALQAELVIAQHGAIEWRWTTPTSPVVAFAGDKVVALLMPIAPSSASEEAW